MDTTAQISLYPLRQVSLGPAIREAVHIFRERGLDPKVGVTSTVVRGEERAVFAALQEAFQQAAGQGDVVMIVALTNAAPPAEELAGW